MTCYHLAERRLAGCLCNTCRCHATFGRRHSASSPSMSSWVYCASSSNDSVQADNPLPRFTIVAYSGLVAL